MYIYSVFAHIYFFNGFDSIEKLHPEGTLQHKWCTSLIHCFFSIIDVAFRNGQGIGDMMIPESFSE